MPKGERFNVECTSTGLVCEHDEYYLSWPRWVSHEEYLAGRYLTSKTPREELAGDLIQRGYCLRDNSRLREAVEACAWASAVAPQVMLHSLSTKQFLKMWLAKVKAKMPPLFPRICVAAPARRRFPDAVPYDLEHDIVMLETVEKLLEDPERERNWWRLLRDNPVLWPRTVPTRIDVRDMSGLA
jgi:hypothetical protein